MLKKYFCTICEKATITRRNTNAITFATHVTKYTMNPKKVVGFSVRNGTCSLRVESVLIFMKSLVPRGVQHAMQFIVASNVATQSIKR